MPHKPLKERGRSPLRASQNQSALRVPSSQELELEKRKRRRVWEKSISLLPSDFDSPSSSCSPTHCSSIAAEKPSDFSRPCSSWGDQVGSNKQKKEGTASFACSRKFLAERSWRVLQSAGPSCCFIPSTNNTDVFNVCLIQITAFWSCRIQQQANLNSSFQPAATNFNHRKRSSSSKNQQLRLHLRLQKTQQQ